MAQVAQHASATSCWAVVDKKVYDLTSWINKHPGGKAAIKQLCGKDGTSAFTAQHGRDGDPKRRLATFTIGQLTG